MTQTAPFPTLLADLVEACTYAPSHGPGNDPYLIREVGAELDRRTSFRGELNNG